MYLSFCIFHLSRLPETGTFHMNMNRGSWDVSLKTFCLISSHKLHGVQFRSCQQSQKKINKKDYEVENDLSFEHTVDNDEEERT